MKVIIRNTRLFVIVLFCLVEIVTIPSANAMRCGTHLISEGDLALEVKQHCGEPDWIDRWFDEVVLGEETDFEHRVSNVTERWVYNFGPKKFISFVTMRNNRVEQIGSGDYGFNIHKQELDCDTTVFSLGMTSLEVQTKCGQPDSKMRRYETVTQALAPGVRQKITVAVDEWIFNLGPNNFVRILTFYKGNLTNIQTGSRGF